MMKLLQLRSEDCSELCDWMNKRLSHDVQNEILQLMAYSVLRKMLNAVKLATFFTVIVDEATNISFKEQVSYVTGSEKTTLIAQLCKKIFLRGTENLTIILPIAVCFRRIAYSVAEL